MRASVVPPSPLAAVALAAGLALTGCGATSTGDGADPASAAVGAAGVGDRLHPGLGNGGYRVTHLGVDLAVDRDLRAYRATSRIAATATQGLSRFHLDSATGRIERVLVDGRPARWRRSGEELLVTPTAGIRDGASFEVRSTVAGRIAEQSATSERATLGLLRSGGWAFTRSLPSGAHRIVPLADHPRHKAPATLRVTTPKGLTGIANGRLTGTRRSGTRTTRTYEVAEPVAPALLQLAAGPLRVVRGTGPERRRLRLAVPSATSPRTASALRDAARSSMRFLRGHLGAEPTSTYGAIVPPRDGPAVETQGLTLLDRRFLPVRGPISVEARATLVHELSHEWFGNGVSVAGWSDLWLAEGHAAYWQHRWNAERGGPSMATTISGLRRVAADVLRKEGPLSAPRPEAYPDRARAPYGAAAYAVGTLVLDALERTVGAPAFARIERAWIAERRGGTGSTADFRALASRVAGRDLSGFFASWLDGTAIPAG